MIKICTSIEQSEKLLSLGLDQSTADMHYEDCIETFKLHAYPSEYGYEYNIPAWSLTALLELMPLYTLEQTTDGKVIAVSEIGQYSKCSEALDNPIDAAFEMVCWLIERKHIKVNK